MKVVIMGYSGSGKSTLAQILSEYYSCDVLHLDSIHFSSGWIERTDEDMITEVKSFLKKKNWVIEGNYSRILFQKRLEDADQIIILNFNRFSCFLRAYKRYKTYKGMTRPDMADGCNEKFDFDFIRWILLDGHSKKVKNRYLDIMMNYPNKTIILKNQKQMDSFINTLK